MPDGKSVSNVHTAPENLYHKHEGGTFKFRAVFDPGEQYNARFAKRPRKGGPRLWTRINWSEAPSALRDRVRDAFSRQPVAIAAE